MSDLGNKEVMAHNIQKYMDMHGVTRRKLSADLNLSYTTLSSWLQGDSYPRIDKIELMANYFHIKKSDLVERQSNEEVTLENALDNVMSFDGKPMTDHDRQVILNLAKTYLDSKEDDNQ